MITDTIDGGCHCGFIRYTLHGQATHITNCHCSDCRRAIGAQAVAWVTVPLAQYEVTQGTPASYRSSPKVERTFCPRCGTSLSYRHAQLSSGIDITLGSLDHPERFAPTKDIFGRDRVAWVKPASDQLED